MIQQIFNSNYLKLLDSVKLALKRYKCEEILIDKIKGNIRGRKASYLTNQIELIEIQLSKTDNFKTSLTLEVSKIGNTNNNQTLNELHGEEIIDMIKQLSLII